MSTDGITATNSYWFRTRFRGFDFETGNDVDAGVGEAAGAVDGVVVRAVPDSD